MKTKPIRSGGEAVPDQAPNCHDGNAKKNGPAATSIAPDHGSIHPGESFDMNKHTNSTARAENPDFPIPYLAQEPDDMALAFDVFDAMDALFDAGCQYGLTRERAIDLMVVFGQAREKLEPILIYLQDDDRDGTLARYQTARRSRILKSWRAAL